MSHKKYHSLIDKVYAPSNLLRAYRRASRKKSSSGCDRISWKQFASDLHIHIPRLASLLRKGEYTPAPFKIVNKLSYDGKSMVIHIPSTIDRVVEHAIRLVIEPIFESIFLDFVAGYRPGKSRVSALRLANILYSDRTPWVLTLQIERLAESIPHDPLISALNEVISDGRLLKLIRQDWQGIQGLPTGSALTPFLCNVYLNQIDRKVRHHKIIRFSNTYMMFFGDDGQAQSELTSMTRLLGDYGLGVENSSTGVVLNPHIENLFLYRGLFD
jgi:RNA-directed DNA polymerase